MTAPTVAFVLKGYPRLSETFIAQEILALERRGLGMVLYSLRRPTDRATHPIHDEIRSPVVYLPEYLKDDPRAVLAAWLRQRRRPGYRTALRTWVRDLRRDPTANRGRRFGQALVLVDQLGPSIRHIHAHFMHTPASVARYAALLAGLPWSLSAHAKDIWTSPDWEKAEKLSDCAWAVTCTASGAAHLRDLAPDPERVALAYHGLDLDRFPPAEPRAERDSGAPVTILSVGRLVEKKGYDDLLAALALLPAALDWRLVQIGGGGLGKALKQQAETLGIAGRIEWRGAQAAAEVLAAYRAADLFVLASKVAGDGDRDGLPNVLMEAQSQNLPCIATAVSAIPELITDGVTGLLVPPGDPGALAKAINRLIDDPALARHLGEAGGQRLRGEFGPDRGISLIAARFGL